MGITFDPQTWPKVRQGGCCFYPLWGNPMGSVNQSEHTKTRGVIENASFFGHHFYQGPRLHQKSPASQGIMFFSDRSQWEPRYHPFPEHKARKKTILLDLCINMYIYIYIGFSNLMGLLYQLRALLNWFMVDRSAGPCQNLKLHGTGDGD